MPKPTIRKRYFAGFAMACALPIAGSALVVGAEQPAIAADVDSQDAFESAFQPFELPAEYEILTPSERVEAETLAAAAPREIVAKPEPESRPVKLGRRLRAGTASFYGKRFAGRMTANGEIFNPRRLTAAHRSLPFGSKVKVTNQRNGRSVVVRINDRGPFHGNRVIDLSREAARQIGLIHAGHGPVDLALVKS